ncbi:acetoin utilization protein acuB [Lutimonas saemankumensis]|uniref:CBS domain-containing protein n=1 Tax=Lutimonas saemankumensis TaxID=483016 RepID=UPI001CD5B3B1|nr:CBS domain-containing protein [Lutimonas saemankumensis]MCA0933528.1 acetoin utilization protein acuB [Lutimonas saemankumensis]
MQTINYILKDIVPFELNVEVLEMKETFEMFPFSHLPVVDDKLFYGAIAHEEVEMMRPDKQKLNEFKHQIQPFYVTENMNWFEVLQNFATHNTNLMPILNSEKEYIGYYELDDFLNLFKCTPFLHEEGVILVVSKNIKDYSFSEISQIVESNNATLFGAFVSMIDADVAHITLKLSLHDINNTLHSFRRYNYEILNEFEKDKYLEELNDRSNYLQKYLNI